MHRRMFMGGVLGLVGVGVARAHAPIATAESVLGYAARLQDGVDRTGGGRFLAETEAALSAAHNRVRDGLGLGVLEPHPGLALAARAHAADQSLRGFFAHQSPEGFGPAERVGLMARTFVGLPGENIVDFKGSYLGVAPERLMDAWMSSPGHHENIVRPIYTHLGLGVVQTGRRTVAVAVFGQRFAELDAPIPLTVAGAQIDSALGAARPAIRSYDLTPVGEEGWSGGLMHEGGPGRMPPGAYTLRPKLPIGGRRYAVVMGPIVALAG